MTRAWTLIALLAPLSGRAQEKAPPGSVTLPLAEYERLADRAARPPKKVDPPPIPSVVARAEARLRVAGGSARGTLTLDGEVFRPGLTKVPLLSGVTVLEARLEGRPLPLLSEGGVETAVLGQGPFAISLEIGSLVATDPGRASLPLPAPLAGSVRATIELPGDTVDVRLEGGLVARKSSARGVTVVEATLDPGGSPRVSWSARNLAPLPPREARFLADVKTLASLGDGDLRLTVLLEMNVVQGDPERFVVHLPHGYELTGASSSSLDAKESQGDLLLAVREPSRRKHQVLLGLERSEEGASFRDAVPLLAVEGAQRETGEVAVEGGGALELAAQEGGGARRMDVQEVAPALRAMAHERLLGAFRYQRHADTVPSLTLDVKRFPDAPVLAAVAEKATVTTLVAAQGRRLTEVTLTLRNHAQKFVRVSLPEGTEVVSAEVDGQAVKPVTGKDGIRVPLLRTGFHATGPYTVSFVYLEPGSPFARKGAAELALPPMDVPVSVLEWELFLPDRYRVKEFGGNAVPQNLFLPRGTVSAEGVPGGVVGGSVAGLVDAAGAEAGSAVLLGRVLESSRQPLPGVTLTLSGPKGTRSSVSDAHGEFWFPGLEPGRYSLSSALNGFTTAVQTVTLAAGQTVVVNPSLRVGSVAETLTVMAEAPTVDTKKSGTGTTLRNDEVRDRSRAEDEGQAAPSANVFALQRRVAGVLPVHVDVPRSGVSYRFLRPLVVDEPTRVTFRYSLR